jgi:hypothetical protein
MCDYLKLVSNILIDFRIVFLALVPWASRKRIRFSISLSGATAVFKLAKIALGVYFNAKYFFLFLKATSLERFSP